METLVNTKEGPAVHLDANTPSVSPTKMEALLAAKEDLSAKADRIAEELRDIEDTIAAEEDRLRKEREAKNIFHKLPIEIRNKIWRLLLRRPATIRPGHVKFTCSKETKMSGGNYWYDQLRFQRYGYRWDERPQTQDWDEGTYRGWIKYEPRYPGGYNCYTQDMTLTVPSKPTATQVQYISEGRTTLPFTFDKEEYGTQVGCEVVQRGEESNQFYQVINFMEASVEPLYSLAIMRVSKQALSETRAVLYGENRFAFDCCSHEHDELEHVPALVPGLPQKDGTPQTARQLENAIYRMFVHDAFIPKFPGRDSMLAFFRRIGRVNTSLLTKIIISGEMKTFWRNESTKPSIGFDRVLDIHTVVLKHACPNLRELTLDKEGNHDYVKENMVWDNDPNNDSGKSDDDRVDEVVEKVVTVLDSLKVLKLGSYQSFEHLNPKDSSTDGTKSTAVFEDEWGRSSRWMNIVDERARRQEKEQAERALQLDSTEEDTKSEFPFGEFGADCTPRWWTGILRGSLEDQERGDRGGRGRGGRGRGGRGRGARGGRGRYAGR